MALPYIIDDPYIEANFLNLATSVAPIITPQSANLIFGGPASAGPTAPTFRSLVGADLPVPSASTLGGVESLASVAHKWINQISTAGVPSASQPAATDLSDFVARTTFTPTITFQTPGDLSVAYTTQTGAYVKVGPMVMFWISLTFTPTYTTASGGFQILGLPVNPTDSSDFATAVQNVGNMTWPGSPATMLAGTITSSGVMNIFGIKSGSAQTAFTTAQYASGVAYTLKFSGFFF